MTTPSFRTDAEARSEHELHTAISRDTARPRGDQHRDGGELLAVDGPLSSVALIDDRTLRRECLRNSLISLHVPWDIAAFGSVDEWSAAADLHPPLAAILFHAGQAKMTDPDVAERIRKITAEFEPKPVIILSDSDDIVQIINAIDCGVRGYIPSSVTIEICIEAIKLVLAGCVFLPASSVLARRQDIASGTTQHGRLAELFTPRQIKVANAMRQGKRNKIIAYELDMCESTVKVHVRNIMKKLNARNRTEVAYKMKDMLGDAGI